jgi:hypothetical protein
MGDDVNIIVPSSLEEEQDDTYEKAGEELVALLTAQAERLGECLARISELETRIVNLEAREYAAAEHQHDGLALSEHSHNYAPVEHQHETRTTEEQRKPDKPPEKQHPYFRKLSEL